MTHSVFATDAEAHGQSICQARVIQLHADGRVSVQIGDDDAAQLICEVLLTSDRHRLILAPDDVVLVWPAMNSTETHVILGRIGPSHAAPGETRTGSATHDETPAELVLEAKHSLTLRVGDGSITIREDGKILIKGKDLVSHAQRLNRIKGGAVQIN